MAARDKTRQGSAATAVLLAADAKKKSVPVWLARNARWMREAPLSEAQRTWLEPQGFKGAARKHVLLPGPDGALAGAVLGLGEERSGDPDRQAGAGRGPAAGTAAARLLSPGRRPCGARARGRRLGARRLPLPALQVGRRRRRRAAEGPARRRSRRRACADRGGLARPRPHQHARERHGAAGAGGCRPAARQDARRRRVEHRRRRPAGEEFSPDPCRRPRQPARTAAHRPHVGPRGGPAGKPPDHARRQGHRLRYGRPRHQAGERHADHEEGHGRGRQRAGARAHDHGGQARRAPAHPDPGGREQHRRQRLPSGRRA